MNLAALHQRGHEVPFLANKISYLCGRYPGRLYTESRDSEIVNLPNLVLLDWSVSPL